MTAILMFGATGQVARCMLEQAESRGLALTALSRDDVDLSNAEAVKAAIAGAADGTVVVNAAAYTAVDQAESERETCFAVNAIAPGAMAEACKARGFALLHISTDYVFDGDKAGAYVETDATDPQGVYGASKLEGERRIAAAHDRWVIMRTAWVYSRHGKNFVKTMIRLGRERDTLGVVDDQRGCPTHAEDIAAALIAVATQLREDDHRFGLYHFAGQGEASWADFADRIFETMAETDGKRPVLNRITTADFPTPAKRPANSILDSSRFSEAFGYTAPDWTDSVSALVREIYTQ